MAAKTSNALGNSQKVDAPNAVAAGEKASTWTAALTTQPPSASHAHPLMALWRPISSGGQPSRTVPPAG